MKPIPILYQDESLIAVDKPAGMLVVQAPGRRGTTVVEALTRQLGHRVYALHRLDESVTGVLVLAATQEAREPLEQIFRTHAATRIYRALLSRAPSPPAGKITSRLQEKDGIVRSVASGPGQKATTLYRILQRQGKHTLVQCELETGRRNQIRVHMADIGCPIVGDRKYGYRVRGGQAYPRPMLHAYQVAFVHPITGEKLQIEAQPSEKDLQL